MAGPASLVKYSCLELPGAGCTALSQVVVCKLNQNEGRPPTEAAATIYADMEPAVPRDPLGLGAAAAAVAGAGNPEEVRMRGSGSAAAVWCCVWLCVW